MSVHCTKKRCSKTYAIGNSVLFPSFFHANGITKQSWRMTKSMSFWLTQERTAWGWIRFLDEYWWWIRRRSKVGNLRWSRFKCNSNATDVSIHQSELSAYNWFSWISLRSLYDLRLLHNASPLWRTWNYQTPIFF